jgi:hypothetical protein
MQDQEPSGQRGDRLRREYIGHVYVDHGGVVVIDPEYVDLSDADRDRMVGAGSGAPMDCDEENLPPGFDHMGVYAPTGLGDGHYPVYADLMDVPGAGTRTARIIIDCLGTEPDQQSDDLRETMVEATDFLRDTTGGSIDVRLPYDEDETVDEEVRRRALGEDDG